MPLKIRVMPGCMVITAQNTCELWHCLEGLSIEPFDPDAAANWIRHYPGGLKFRVSPLSAPCCLPVAVMDSPFPAFRVEPLTVSEVWRCSGRDCCVVRETLT
mgnify:FL=1